MDNLNLEIKHFGMINEAKININKINVVAGVNSSGKSTASRFLYCFLKANELSKKENIKKVIVDKINNLLDNKEDTFTIDDDFSTVLKKYNIFKQDSQENSKFNEIDLLIECLSADNSEIISYSLSKLVLEENVDLFEGGSSKLSSSSFESLIANEDVNAEIDEAGFVQSYSDEYDINTDLYVIKTSGALENYNDIWYIDSFSLLDLLYFSNYVQIDDSDEMAEVISPKNHIHCLLINKKLPYRSIRDIDKTVLKIYKKIGEIIQGNIDHAEFTHDFYFTKNSPIEDETYGTLENPAINVSSSGTSSGTKQIGIIQTMLLNGKLKRGSFLIIDEPEVSLHPKWQFKLAEILVNMVKELDIILYINSHSPTFIESIDVFCEFYDMEDKINFYLTEESEIKGKYNFSKINSNELYKIYSNLGNVYDEINKLRIRKKLNNRS